MGAADGRIIFRHLLPNTAGVIIVDATLARAHDLGTDEARYARVIRGHTAAAEGQPIIAGLWNASGPMEQTKQRLAKAKIDLVTSSLSEAIDYIENLAHRRRSLRLPCPDVAPVPEPAFTASVNQPKVSAIEVVLPAWKVVGKKKVRIVLPASMDGVPGLSFDGIGRDDGAVRVQHQVQVTSLRSVRRTYRRTCCRTSGGAPGGVCLPRAVHGPGAPEKPSHKFTKFSGDSGFNQLTFLRYFTVSSKCHIRQL